RSFAARHEMDIDRHRRVNDVGRSIAVEVPLFHAAIFERDCSLRHELRNSERNPCLKLAFDSERIHGDTRVNRDGYAVNLWPLVFDRDVRSTGDTGSE